MNEKTSTVEKRMLYGWEVLEEGCAFATGEGSVYVDGGRKLVVFGSDSQGRRNQISLLLPPGVKIILDPDTKAHRGFRIEESQLEIDTPMVHANLKLEPTHNLAVRMAAAEKEIEVLKRKIAEMEGD